MNDDEILAAVELALARWADLQTATERLETRKLVERAKGMLMQGLRLGEDEAHRLLHRQSRNLRRPMRDVARAIVTAAQVVEKFGRRRSDPEQP